MDRIYEVRDNNGESFFLQSNINGLQFVHPETENILCDQVHSWRDVKGFIEGESFSDCSHHLTIGLANPLKNIFKSNKQKFRELFAEVIDNNMKYCVILCLEVGQEFNHKMKLFLENQSQSHREPKGNWYLRLEDCFSKNFMNRFYDNEIEARDTFTKFLNLFDITKDLAVYTKNAYEFSLDTQTINENYYVNTDIILPQRSTKLSNLMVFIKELPSYLDKRKLYDCLQSLETLLKCFTLNLVWYYQKRENVTSASIEKFIDSQGNFGNPFGTSQDYQDIHLDILLALLKNEWQDSTIGWFKTEKEKKDFQKIVRQTNSLKKGTFLLLPYFQTIKLLFAEVFELISQTLK